MIDTILLYAFTAMIFLLRALGYAFHSFLWVAERPWVTCGAIAVVAVVALLPQPKAGERRRRIPRAH